MSKNEQIRSSGCPIAYGLDIIGDRWSLLVIRDIMIRGNKTYSDFLEAEEGIASNILNDRLKKLTNLGILDKSRDPNNRRSFVYELTEKGHDLAPLVIEMVIWSGKHDTRENASKEVLAKVLEDKRQFEMELRGK
ncbi:winged helix-turn-helix transcriptional regulator [Lentilitoribacter sp. EG35]|uniref:winged helix-turn-helix transcriptional regulator n=1 Tax=Lentilitoribacter sp. EG35 TaxID=3234192 RepID=UPI0034613F1E